MFFYSFKKVPYTEYFLFFTFFLSSNQLLWTPSQVHGDWLRAHLRDAGDVLVSNDRLCHHLVNITAILIDRSLQLLNLVSPVEVVDNLEQIRNKRLRVTSHHRDHGTFRTNRFGKLGEDANESIKLVLGRHLDQKLLFVTFQLIRFHFLPQDVLARK